MPPTPQAIADCIQVLEALVADPALLAAIDRAECQRLVMAAGRVSRPNRAERKSWARAVQKKGKDSRRADFLVVELDE